MAHDSGGWRPQAFGRRRSRDVRNAVVEPGWDGARVLVHVRPPDPVRLIDIDGEDLADSCGAIVAALEGAIRAESAVFDGYLTYQATARPGATLPGGDDEQTLPRHVSRLVLGATADRFLDARPNRIGRVRGGSVELPEQDADEPDSGERDSDEDADQIVVKFDAAADGPLAFVAVDLLEVDGTLLLDVPLLERKRILDGVLVENLLIRKSMFIREPVNSFLLTWRTAGFRELAYKDANSRYRPGTEHDGWVLAPMPRR